MATATVEIPTQMLQIRRKILGDFAVHLSLMLFHELLILFPMAIFVLLLSGPQLCYLDLNVCYLILQLLHVVPVVHEEVVVVLYLYLSIEIRLLSCIHAPTKATSTVMKAPMRVFLSVLSISYLLFTANL